jgi:hypothetical protein
MEQNGARHIKNNSAKSEAISLGGSRWAFSLIFDTQTIQPLPQKDAAGKIKEGSDSTDVRFKIKILSPFGTSASLVHSMKIVQATQKAASADISSLSMLPRFDMSGVGSDVLELSPGDKLKLKFRVEALEETSVVSVESAQLAEITGKPSLQCANSKKGARLQECTLDWSVPCNISQNDMPDGIAFNAVASSGGLRSDNSTVLKLKFKAGACK